MCGRRAFRHANRVVRAEMVLEAARNDAATPPIAGDEVAAFAGLCSNALAEAAEALREQRAPAGSFALRDSQRALAATIRAAGGGLPGAYEAALLDASDRVVDAIDSVLHVLAQPYTAR